MATAIIQFIYAGLGGCLMGDTIQHQFGIFFVLMALAPIVHVKG